MEKLSTQHEADTRTKKTLDKAKLKLATALAMQDHSHHEELDRLQSVCICLKSTKREFELFVTVCS